MNFKRVPPWWFTLALCVIALGMGILFTNSDIRERPYFGIFGHKGNWERFREELDEWAKKQPGVNDAAPREFEKATESEAR